MKRKNNAKNISKKIIKKAKGITLISLVITIIILLILAGVTLSLTLGDNGIITQAQKAKEAHEIAAIKEDFQLAILDKELEKGGTGLTQEELEEIAGNYGELQEDGNTIITDDGYEIKIDEIYQPGGGTSEGGSGASDEELAALLEKIKELEQTVEDLNNTKTELEGTIEDLNKQLEEEQGNNRELQEQIENLQGQVDTLTKTKEELEATISDLNMQIASLKEKQATGNATVAQVLEGATFSNSSSVGLTGTMVNRGAINQSLNAGGTYTIPAGYHNGSGKITANSLSSQTSATAGAGQILSGYTAWVNGSKITGTMTNRGAWSSTPTGSGSVTIPAGYHNGSGKVNTSTVYNNGYNAGKTSGKQPVIKTYTPTASTQSWQRLHDGGWNTVGTISLNLGFTPNYVVFLCDTYNNSQYLRSVSVYVRSLNAIYYSQTPNNYGGCMFYAKSQTSSNLEIPVSEGSVECTYYAW